MTYAVNFIEGPYAGQHVELPQEPPDSIGLGVDEWLNPVPSSQSRPAILAMYRRVGSQAPSAFQFSHMARHDGKQFEIQFYDGPLEGLKPSPQPARYWQAELHIPLNKSEEPPESGPVKVDAVAVYHRCERAGTWGYAFKEIVTSGPLIEEVAEELCGQYVRRAMDQFYKSPDHSIYTIKPGLHKEVPLQVGKRRASVDELMAPLIKELWRLDLDTLGSCQERPAGSPNEGLAYVAFPAWKQGLAVHNMLAQGGVEVSYKLKTGKLGNSTEDGATRRIVEVTMANVFLPTSNIAKATELLRGVTSTQMAKELSAIVQKPDVQPEAPSG